MPTTAEILSQSNLKIRGTFNKGKPDEIIFQKTIWGLQHYAGPKIPLNRRVQNQQLQRLQFKAAAIAASQLSPDQINYFKSLIPKDGPPRSWRMIFYSHFIKNRSYGQSKFGLGIHSTETPPVSVLRYGAKTFGEGIYSKPENLPVKNEAFTEKYGDFPFDY